jgi:hypothetical protein
MQRHPEMEIEKQRFQEEEMLLDERLAALHRSVRVAAFANRAMRQVDIPTDYL